MPAERAIQNPPRATRPAQWSSGVIGLFGVAVVLAIARLFLPLWRNSGWPDAGLLILAVAATIAALAKQLPVVNVALAAGIAAGIGGVAHAVNDVAGLPFGRFDFNTALGPRLLGVLPVAIPGLWAVAALSARGTARVALRESRDHPYHGYHVIGLAVLLMIAFQGMLHPFGATLKHWWSQNPSPALNLIGTGGVSLTIQVIITALLLDKFPGSRPPNFWPLATWLALNGLLAVGLFAGRRLAEALLAVAVGGIILVLALRNGGGTVMQRARTT